MRVTSLTRNEASAMAAIHLLTDMPWNPLWSSNTYEEFLAPPTRFASGIMEGDNLVSFILYQKSLDVIDILYVATRPDAQLKGYGSALLSHVSEENKGCSFFLEVCTENTPAVALYKKNGFQTLHLRKKYYKDLRGNIYDALLMNKALLK